MLERLKLLWPPYRRRVARDAEYAEWRARRREAFAALNAADWTDWCYAAPPREAWVETIRIADYSDGAYKPAILRRCELPDWFNVVDLYWRPVHGAIIEYAAMGEIVPVEQRVLH